MGFVLAEDFLNRREEPRELCGLCMVEVDTYGSGDPHAIIEDLTR